MSMADYLNILTICISLSAIVLGLRSIRRSNRSMKSLRQRYEQMGVKWDEE